MQNLGVQQDIQAYSQFITDICVRGNDQGYSWPSISGEGRLGVLFRSKAAFPLANKTDNL